MNSPKCFVAIFGDPQPPRKNRVESGEYHPDPQYAPFPTDSGDFILLYCTGSYPQRFMQIAGIGVVLSTDSESVKYRWLPFKEPIPKSQIDVAFEPADLKRFGNIRLSSHWLFEISLKSFCDTVASQKVDWPDV